MIPNAPTDNLYKFVTFLGLALLMFCVWGLIDNERKIEESILLAELHSRQFANNTEALKRQSDALIEKYSALEKRVKESHTPGDADVLIAQSKSIEKEIDDIQKEIKLAEVDSLDLNKKVQNARIIFKSNLSQLYWLYCGMAIGSMMTIFGFWSWYARHQRYQDELLQLQVAQAKASKQPDNLPTAPPTTA